MPKKDNLSTVRINENLAKTIDNTVHSEIGKKYGFRSRADFVTRACRELLKEYHQVVPRFVHINTYEDHATIRDNKIGKLINIYFKEEGVAYCEYCKETSCEHIDYTVMLPEVTEPLEKRGWKQKYA